METQTGKKPIRVLIVDDHPVVRAGLTSLLRKESGLKVVGAAYNGEVALDLIRHSLVDVVLLDLRMPKIGGIDFLTMLREISTPPAVLILSSYAYEEEIYRALKAGARGYLSKDASGAQIVEAINTVKAGGKYFSAEIKALFAERESRSSLSTRETEILEMVAKGLTNKEIARVLQISQYTVRNHINHIGAKLEVGDRTEAVSVALQQGILGPR
ncbi:MAG TPA: response regulator transcription factor [Terracidiphilus sp.]|nr:response regulator transcription factor [Terracidiphilus sp.]